jgi:hypothetical protein
MNGHLLDDFYVVAVMTNPERFNTRSRLFREFMERMIKYGVNLFVVEGAFGDREFEVTDASNPRHIQIRTESELWHKENLINIGITRLPSTWKYVAWIDGDIDFIRPDWALETVHELQHHPVVQLFEDAIDTGPEHEVMNIFKGFAYCFKNKLSRKIQSDSKVVKDDGEVEYPYYYGNSSPGSYWHPGYAWAATRDAINTLGGLFEIGIVGAGDHHMACALIGEGAKSVPKGIHPQYKAQVLAWESRASRLHKNIGYVRGSIYHFWHGKKRNRKYKERWQIIIGNNFNPSTDIHKDWQGVLTLYPGHDKLKSEIREYFQSRNEDSVDKE